MNHAEALGRRNLEGKEKNMHSTTRWGCEEVSISVQGRAGIERWRADILKKP